MIDHNEEEFEYDGPSKSQLSARCTRCKSMGKQMLGAKPWSSSIACKFSEHAARAIDESRPHSPKTKPSAGTWQYIGKIIVREPTRSTAGAITAFSAGSLEHTTPAITWPSAGAGPYHHEGDSDLLASF